MTLKCTTCGKNLVGQDKFVRFNCPVCGECEIVRCNQCQMNSNEYECEKCKFIGP